MVSGLIWCSLVKIVHPSNVRDFGTRIECNKVIRLFKRARYIFSLKEGAMEVPVSMIKNLIKEKYFFLVVQVARTKAFFGFFKPFDLTYMLFGHGFSKTDLDIQASH